jgi:hypothetical protein
MRLIGSCNSDKTLCFWESRHIVDEATLLLFRLETLFEEIQLAWRKLVAIFNSL